MQKVDLCEECAKQKGVNDPAGFSLADLLLGLGASLTAVLFGRDEEAVSAYSRALELAPSETERTFLESRLATSRV